MPISIQHSLSFASVQNHQPVVSDKSIQEDTTSLRHKTDTVSLNGKGNRGSSQGYGIDVKLTSIIRRVDLALAANAKAGEHSEFFSAMSHALWEDADLQIAFHEFSASLSEEDLGHFLTALEQNPGNLASMLDIASRLSDEALSPFLEGAALAGEDVDDFLNSVNDLLADEEGLSAGFQYTFLAAGVSRGENIMSFIDAAEDMAGETLEAVAEFAATELGIPDGLNEDMDLFASIFGSANQENLMEFMALAQGLADDDKTNLLRAVSQAGNDDLGDFLRQAKGRTGAELSDYLEVASDAEGRLESFIELAGSIDLSAVREFSAVDTVNFLDAAQGNPGGIDDLTRMGISLSGTDRSYLIYAAAGEPGHMDGLLETAGTLSGQVLSDYLLGEANGEGDTRDAAIFMTAILADDEYDNFQRIAGQLSGDEMDTLTEMTDVLSGQRRSEFLMAGAASGASANEFLTMFDTLSSGNKADYLDVAARLDTGNRENFVQASVNAGGSVDEFIRLTGELMDQVSETIYVNQRDALDNFLSLAKKAGPDELEGLIDLVGELGFDQRAGFLRVAERSGLDVGDMTRLGRDALSLGSRFNDIFGHDNAIAGNTNLSVKDYENLIHAAKSEDDQTWNTTRFSTFYRDYPGADLWA